MSEDTECQTCGRGDFVNAAAVKQHRTKAHDNEEDDSECPTCGRDDFANAGNMKRHHAHAHDTSIAGVEVECSWCGERKCVKPNVAESKEHFFCGEKDCQARWQSGNWLGENSPRWEGGMVAVNCIVCGREKEVPPYNAEQSEYHICGDGSNCRSKLQSERWSGEGNPDWKGGRVTVNCHLCGDEKSVRPYAVEKYDRHFCGNCRIEWFTQSGENNPNWRGGTYPYGAGFSKPKKERIRDRQDRQCAGCGTHESELTMKLDIHHIMKARTFDNAEARNDEDNLVALCRSCHTTWEKMSPLRPQTAD